jgi:hypothetical protein
MTTKKVLYFDCNRAKEPNLVARRDIIGIGNMGVRLVRVIVLGFAVRRDELLRRNINDVREAAEKGVRRCN